MSNAKHTSPPHPQPAFNQKLIPSNAFLYSPSKPLTFRHLICALKFHVSSRTQFVSHCPGPESQPDQQGFCSCARTNNPPKSFPAGTGLANTQEHCLPQPPAPSLLISRALQATWECRTQLSNSIQRLKPTSLPIPSLLHGPASLRMVLFQLQQLPSLCRQNASHLLVSRAWHSQGSV